MATSPNTSTLTPKKKDESFLDKLGGTLARKKKSKEVTELQEEGKNAIESPTSPTIPDIGPEGYHLGENEERSMIEPTSREDPKLRELIKTLLDWINDELSAHRIIVKDIEEDLFDGQILQKLIEKLCNIKVDAPEVTQSEIGQKQKLRVILDYINSILNLPPVWNQQKWSVDSIHSKNLVAILHLLVTLARHFRAPIRMPENVSVILLVVQKVDNILQTRRIVEEITTTNDDIGAKFERDAFDTLFDHAPDKLNVVKKTLVTFVNKQLMNINLEVTDLDTQFHDGVYLVLIMGLLENYFVPLHSFYLTPTTTEQKIHNVMFSFELMHDAGLPKNKARLPRPEDVVNMDLKSTLRVLYNVFTKYKDTRSTSTPTM
ncbi:beta-parvin-like [Gigantopelta aegis]|uniref:beta-parvin-like n=1 Tax=Gigantopelta aegis TaxID=1735272 RepID=UPI001B889935|nr:beta-parvin-like [Gigantopelta aegis]